MQAFLAIAASAIWLFISGAIVFAAILPEWFNKNFAHITRDPKKLPIWAIVAEKVLQAIALTLLVRWTEVPILSLMVIPLLFVSTTYLFSTYANYKVAGRPVVVIALIDGARIVVGLIIVGAILGHAFA